MTNQPTKDEGRRELESVHKCPKCGHLINLDETDLRVISTGMISCQNCKWLGPVRITIMEELRSSIDRSSVP
jgi:predicted RNA-binding Zn-ribbon protein involved in translation (DUF1610 family)